MQTVNTKMKEYIKNLSVGLAILSMAAGIVLIVSGILQYVSQFYVFNLFNACITVIAVLALHGSAIIGKKILEYKKE